MFRKIDIKRVSIWLLIIMVLAFVVAGTIFAFEGYSGIFSDQENKINEEKILVIDNIKNVTINTVSTDINVIPTDSKDLKVHFYGDYSGKNIPKLETDSYGDKVNIKIKHPKVVSLNFSFSFHNSLRLDVYIPKTYTGSTDINTTSGDLTMDSFSLDKIKFNSVSGDLAATSLSAKEFTITTTSGDADIKNLNGNLLFKSVSGDIAATSVNTKEFAMTTTSGNASIKSFNGNLLFKSVSGDIDAEYSSFNNNVKVSTTSGDTKISLPSASEFKLDFNSVSGNTSSDFPVDTSDNPGNHHTTGTIGNSSNSIEIDSVSGDLEIRKY